MSGKSFICLYHWRIFCFSRAFMIGKVPFKQVIFKNKSTKVIDIILVQKLLNESIVLDTYTGRMWMNPKGKWRTQRLSWLLLREIIRSDLFTNLNIQWLVFRAIFAKIFCFSRRMKITRTLIKRNKYSPWDFSVLCSQYQIFQVFISTNNSFVFFRKHYSFYSKKIPHWKFISLLYELPWIDNINEIRNYWILHVLD